VTGDDSTGEPAPGEGTIVLLAIRSERRWITRDGAHGVVVHSRTLRDLRASAQQALALSLDTPTAPPVQVHPQSAELDALAEARLRYQSALRQAVQTLHADGSTWNDIAQACHVRIAEAQAALTDHRGDTPSPR
jgi:hypothetical protein